MPRASAKQKYVVPARYDWENVALPPLSAEEAEALLRSRAPSDSGREPGMLKQILNIPGAIVSGLPVAGRSALRAAHDSIWGFDPEDAEEMRQRAEEKRAEEEYLRKYQGQTPLDAVPLAMPSTGYSLATLAGGLSAGALGALVPVPGAAAAGMLGGSAAVAYRATTSQFEEALHEIAGEALGRKPSPEEWARIREHYARDIREYGAWEAAPEAAGNLLFAKIFGPLRAVGKGLPKGLFKSKVVEYLAKAGGAYGSEMATETITGTGQSAAEARIGMRGEAQGPLEVAGEIAPQVLAQTLLLGGGHAGLKKLASYLPVRGEVVSAEIVAEDPVDKYARPEHADKPGMEVGLKALVERAQGKPLALPTAPERVEPDFVVDESGAARQAGPQMPHTPFDERTLPPVPPAPALAPGDGAIPMGAYSTGRGPIAPPYVQAPALPPLAPPAVSGRGPEQSNPAPPLPAPHSMIKSEQTRETPYVEPEIANVGYGDQGNPAPEGLRQLHGGIVGERADSHGQRPGPGGGAGGDTGLSGIRGKRIRIAVPNREKLEARYEAVDASELRPSHLPASSFQKNPRYRLENERRYHEEAASQQKVLENAGNLDPDLLMQAPDANQGAPIIDHEGNVLGGNGRAMSILRAYENHPERAGAYKETLLNNAETLGLDKNILGGMGRPVLVRRVSGILPLRERQKLVSDLNSEFTHRREARAEGKSRGGHFSMGTLQSLGNALREADSLRQALDEPSSKAIVDRLISDGVIKKEEQNAYVGADGLLNSDGKKVVEEALRGRAIKNYDTIARLPADILGKLDASIPHILVAETIGRTWDITAHVGDAMELAADFRHSGQKNADIFLKQNDMLKGKPRVELYSREAIWIFKNAVALKKSEFASLFEKYAAQAKISPEAGGMPGISRPQPEVFKEVFGGVAEEAGKKAAGGGKIALKLGETIGGSRADTAAPTGKRSVRAKDSVPAWKKPYQVMQSLKDGRWRIFHENTGRPVSFSSFDTVEEAEAAVPLAAVAVKHRVYSGGENGSFRIIRQVTDRKRVTIKDGFATEEEAMRHMAAHAVEILETRTGYGEEILPAPENVYRKGAPRRSGDVKPEDFLKDFGFRGAEFGKWNNQAERQELLNHAYDALMDLAEIIDVPPKAISLNGELGIAFGARGHGLSGAKAHYESGHAVINLTKMSGAGSLAHEWLHALDNYFARMDGKTPAAKVKNERGDLVYPVESVRRAMASHGFSLARSGVREEVRKAYKSLMDSMFSKAEKYVEDSLAAEKFMGKARNALKERLDELRDYLAKEQKHRQRFSRPATLEELAQFDALAARLLDGENMELAWRANENAPKRANSLGTGRYSNDLLDGISAILKKVRGISGFYSDRGGLLDRLGGYMRTYKKRAEVLESAKKSDEKVKRVATRYRMEARRMDEGRVGDHWGTEHEMLARAFAAFVEDRAAARGIASEFLVYGANNDIPAFRIMGVRPYPAGAERTAINKAFEDFFGTLEARETGKGVALASLADGEAVGQVTPEMAENMPLRKSGYIRLGADAIKHIEQNHGKEIRGLGFSGAREFVEFVLSHVDAVYQGKGKRNFSLVTRQSRPHGQVMAYLEFREEGDGYRVTTANPIREDFFKNKNPLWERAQSNRPGGTPRASAGAEMRGDTGQSGVSKEDDSPSGAKVNDKRPAISPGEFLSERQAKGPPVLKSAVQRVVDAFSAHARKAASTVVVERFDELPARLRQVYAGKEKSLEGVYDPETGVVYMVSSNIQSAGRAADLWMHEQIAHHGLRSLYSGRELNSVLDMVWRASGGLGNMDVRVIAERYGLNTNSASGRRTAAEEYLAALAERGNNGRLSPKEESVWRRIARIIAEAWRGLVNRLTGRDSTMRPENIDELLRALNRHVMDGLSATQKGTRTDGRMSEAYASVDSKEAEAHKAWEQLRADMREWSRQLDEFDEDKTERLLIRICRTPDVLLKLGFPALPMSITGSNLAKVMSDKEDHGLPANLLKNLPVALAEPIMVFESASRAGSHVILTELKHEGRSVMVAVTMDKVQQNIRVNEIVSAYRRKSESWYVSQIQDGRLVYQDKKKSLAWARTNRLQLPKVRISPRGLEKKILTENDIVKPVPPPPAPAANDNSGNGAPMASLLGGIKSAWSGREKSWSGISAEDLRADPDLESALGKVGSEKPALGEKWAALKSNLARTLEQGIFDQFASIKDVSPEGYRLARMTTSLGTQLQFMIEHGAPVWLDGAMAKKKGSKGLTEIFAPVAGEMDRFLAWMIGNRAARLKAEGRENLFSEKEIAAMLRLRSGSMEGGQSRSDVYGKVFREFAQFKKSVLDFAEEAGLFAGETRSLWENADYIPFHRVQERMGETGVHGPGKGKGLTGQASGIRTLKGGLENIGDPLENIMRNFAHMIVAAQKNRAAAQSLRDMEKAGLAQRVPFERMKKEMELGRAEMRDAIKEMWGDANALGAFSEREKDAILALWRPPSGFNSVMVAGRQAWYTISDPLLHRALTSMGRPAPDGGALFKAFRAMRRVLTTGVTVMPDFIARNFTRDALTVWVQEHNSKYNPFDAVRKLRNVYARDEHMQNLLAAGGAFMGSGYRIGHNSEAAASAIKKLLEKSGMDKRAFEGSLLDGGRKIGAFLGKAFRHYERMASASENATRRAVYEKLLAQGRSHGEAAFAAKDLMDFTMRGEWATIKYLCETVPFLGARLAGLHKLGRSAAENPRAFAVKGFSLAAASVALYALNTMLNGDEWDKLEDWDRDSYFHFWVGGEHFRLPKPFEVGFIFGTMPERIAEQAATDKPFKVLLSRAAMGVMEQLSFNPIPQAIRPIVEQAANKDFFRGRPIVSQGMERRVPTEQYTQYTSHTARALAGFMDALLTPAMGKTGGDILRSPARIEHMIQGFFGGLGMFSLGMSDIVLGGLLGMPEKPAMRPQDMPLIRSFYRGNKVDAASSRHITAFYDALDEANKLYSMIKQDGQEGGDGKAARDKLNPEELALLAARKGLNRAAASISRLNRDAKLIRESRNLSPEVKRKRLDLIQHRKNEIAREIVKKLEAA